MYHVIIILLVIIDQAVKFVVSSSMRIGETIPLIEDIVHITYTRNSGGAFSILQGQTAILILIPAVLTTVIVAYIAVKRKNTAAPYLIALTLIAAGGAGNLIDRVRMGEVVDFIDFRFFPIFNFADICVCCGCGLLLLYMVLYDRRSNSN